jgi:FkbM family methyltransferase
VDKKWIFAARHGGASVLGIARLFLTHPGFATALLGRRWRYFRTRRFEQPLLTPDQFLIDTPDTLIAYWSMLVERELHDPEWVRAVTSQPRPLIVDVGANAGVFSHYVHSLNPNGEFIAFEPLPGMVERIRALQARTKMDLVCVQKAVSKQSGEAFFESPHGYDGTSRLSTTEQPGANRFRVETTTLDAVLAERKITLMKVDVEGFECDVIEGGRRSLANTDFLIIEAEDPGHLAKVTAALGDHWTCRKVGATDYLFVRKC